MPPKMHPTTRLKFISYSLKTVGAAIVSALLLANAHAAGLGKLTVFSALGQPLHAEIELTAVSKDDVGNLLPKLASVEAFRQANIEFNPALFSLRFAVEQRGGRQYIRVTSAQPINEPFVDMLLELGGAGNHLVREYTFLLDPAELRSSQSPQASPPVMLPPAPLARRTQEPVPAEIPAPATAARQGQAAPQTAARTTPRLGEKRETAAKNGAAPDEYLVRQGDTLSKIAGRVKPEGVSLDQMLVALYRTNPDAFLGNNMNRLRAGQILSVPDTNAAAGVGQGEARGVIVAQAVDFNSYRDKLAGKVAAAVPQKSAEAKQSAAGKITAKVEEQPTAANLAKDKLKLSKSGTATGQDKVANIGADAEEKIARDKAIAEANSRVKELEKNVSDLQKLLELKDKSLAEQQKQADAAKAALKAAGSGAAAVVASSVGVKPAETKLAEAKPAETKPAEAKPAADPAPAAKPAASIPAASAPAKAAATKPKPKPATPPAPPETSFLDDLLNSELLWPVVGLLLAAFGAFGIYRMRSRRNEQKKNFGDSIITDSSLKANSLFGSTGGQSVDTNNSVFNSNFTPSSHQLDTNEVDPVAEADVYIAYGRDAQAEEILKEALRTQPTRNAVRIKLLEIYSNRKDLRAFEILATELYGMTKGEGEDWIQAANLGIAIDPKNPLYAAGKLPEDTIQKPSALTAPTLPLDEPDLDALLAVTQSDASLETINTIEDSSYFGNTAIAAEEAKPNQTQKAVAPVVPMSNELDFDLQGISLDQIEVPNTIIRTDRVEPKADLDAINFDFLDEATAAPEPIEIETAPPAATTIAGAIATDDSLRETARPGVAAAHEPSAAMEFDLSDITLELNADEAKQEPAPALQETPDVDSHDYSNSAEMATKLDLAVAYQEIGDKEGARELLEEVVKGGTPEQTERAKSVLLKLG